MKTLIIGTGYVGLVTGICFAETGIDVVCVDIDQGKIDKLNRGIIPIFEPDLEPMLKRNMEKGRLTFSSSIQDHLNDIETVFIAVGTPPREDGSADLSHVIEVAREIGKYMRHYLVIITKSTVPIGTSNFVKDTVQKELDLRGLAVPFDVASNPEFLKEGAAVADFMNPDRIILGIESENARKILDRLYQPFLLSWRPIIHMDIISAELTKYAANCMLATKISFMNELANLCDIVNADINNVRLGIGSDPRIGNSFINAGVGFGGSCFPKDLRALIKTANDCGYSLEIIKAAERVNQMQKEVLFNKINAHFKGDLTRKTFALWGLSFKPDTDDIREASSLRIIEQLSNAGAQIRAYDPIAMKIAKKMLSQPIEYCNNMYEALHDASGLLLVTEWSEFRIPNFALMAQIMKEKIIFDGRNIYNPSELEEVGFTYYGIGRRKGSLAS